MINNVDLSFLSELWPPGCPSISGNPTSKRIISAVIGSPHAILVVKYLNVTQLVTLALIPLFISFARLRSP